MAQTCVCDNMLELGVVLIVLIQWCTCAKLEKFKFSNYSRFSRFSAKKVENPKECCRISSKIVDFTSKIVYVNLHLVFHGFYTVSF